VKPWVAFGFQRELQARHSVKSKIEGKSDPGEGDVYSPSRRRHAKAPRRWETERDIRSILLLEMPWVKWDVQSGIILIKGISTFELPSILQIGHAASCGGLRALGPVYQNTRRSFPEKRILEPDRPMASKMVRCPMPLPKLIVGLL